jgi:GR25 family glycosyltransferase involved in LPS biosynthesis
VAIINLTPAPPPGDEFYAGYYINLDRSTDRRERIEGEIAKAGLSGRYRRFAATDGMALPSQPGITPGERGCFHSHMSVLEQALAVSKPLHILEDDAILSQFLAPTIRFIDGAGVLADFDIVFTETLVPPDLKVIKWMKALYDQAVAASPPGGFDPAQLKVIDLARHEFSMTSSYVVNPRRISTLARLCREEWENGPTLPYDLFLRREARKGRLRAACLMPFVTSIDIGSGTTIAGRSKPLRGNPGTGTNEPSRDRPNLSALVLAVVRYSFFVGRDLENHALPILADALDRTTNREPDAQRDLIAKALGFVISDWYEQF